MIGRVCSIGPEMFDIICLRKCPSAQKSDRIRERNGCRTIFFTSVNISIERLFDEIFDLHKYDEHACFTLKESNGRTTETKCKFYITLLIFAILTLNIRNCS